MTWAAALLPAVLAGVPPAALGQARLEIDSSEGRRIAGGIQYEFVTFGGTGIDHDLGLLYVVESADPFRAQALSLIDGTVRGVFGAGEGDGPGELRAVVSVAAVEGGGVMMADHGRILRWDAQGDLLYTWTPAVPGVPNVCALRGRPVIAVLGGVALRSADGTTETVPFELPSPEALFPGNERAEEIAMDLHPVGDRLHGPYGLRTARKSGHGLLVGGRRLRGSDTGHLLRRRP